MNLYIKNKQFFQEENSLDNLQFFLHIFKGDVRSGKEIIVIYVFDNWEEL